MRLVSFDGKYDVAYEDCSLEIVFKSRCVYAHTHNSLYLLAQYDSESDMLDALDNLHVSYANDKKVFQF